MDADIPDNSKVRSSFEHVDSGSIECDYCSANSNIAFISRKDNPFRQVETMRPLVRAFISVVIFDIGFSERLFSQFPLAVCLKSRNKFRFNPKGHWDGAVFRDCLRCRSFFSNLDHPAKFVTSSISVATISSSLMRRIITPLRYRMPTP